MAVRARIGGTVLAIVTETMTLKAFSQRTCGNRSKFGGAREYLSGRRENMSAVKKMNMLSKVPGDREGSVIRIS